MLHGKVGVGYSRCERDDSGPVGYCPSQHRRLGEEKKRDDTAEGKDTNRFKAAVDYGVTENKERTGRRTEG